VHLKKESQFLIDQGECLPELQPGGGIEHIVARCAIMDPSPGIPTDFRDSFHNCHHIVADLEFDCLCPFQRCFLYVLLNPGCSFGRDHAMCRFSISKRNFGSNHIGNPVLLTPYGTHLRCSITLLDGVGSRENRTAVWGYRV